MRARMRVGAFVADPARNRLLLGDAEFSAEFSAEFPIEPLVMDVLCLLAERAGEVVSRGEIIDHVWMVNAGGDESLTRAIGMLRQAFAHDPEETQYIETVWRRGYALIAPVAMLDSAPVTVAQAPGSAIATDHAAPSYSVAVLPFANASVDPGDAFLADGVTRDLTMLLGRVPRLRVAAYSSALTVREGDAPLRHIADALGVRYVVSGSLARSGPNFQLRVALMDAGDDAQVWAKRIDAPLADFYRVQDRIVLDVSTSLASALQISHAATIQGRRPFQLSAYELVQRAEALRLHYNRQTAREIVALLDRALAVDPQDATVHAALAVQHTQNVVSSFVADAGESFALAKRHVETALDLAPDDPEALAAAGIAATMMGNARRAVRHLERAVELDPNNPHTLAVLGWQRSWLEGTADGKALIETAEARAPHHPRYAVWAHYRGHCEMRLGNVEAAIAAYRDAEQRNPGYSLNLAIMAAALGLAGHDDEATDTIRRLREVSPDYRPDNLAALARRMIYWFGESPSETEFITAFRRAWETATR